MRALVSPIGIVKKTQGANGVHAAALPGVIIEDPGVIQGLCHPLLQRAPMMTVTIVNITTITAGESHEADPAHMASTEGEKTGIIDHVVINRATLQLQ
jgi:hypothetical protein